MRARRLDRNILWVLVGGFSLTILLLIGAGYSGVQAVDAIERGNAALHERHRVTTHVIDEIQRDEAGLSSLFYALVASPQPLDDAELLGRLSVLEHEVRQTLVAARTRSEEAAPLQAVSVAVDRFIGEVRRVIQASGSRPGHDVRLYEAHEALVTELSSLVSVTDARMVDEVTGLRQRGSERIQRAGVLLGIGLLGAIGCAVATVAVALSMFRRTEWQAGELARLSAHVLETQEQILRRFSHELHDELGQTLTAIEANLASLPAHTPDEALRKEDSVLLVKDAIVTVRELSQLLRPSTLDDFGLASSLQWLAESFAQRTRIVVEPKLAFEGRLQGDVETHLFRIAQEALTNVARHSGATSAIVSLAEQDGRLRLSVEDNGRGLPAGVSSQSGFGLIGMRERMRAAGGALRVQSGGRGVTVIAEVPLHAAQPA